MANRIPLVFDTQNSQLQELPSGDNLNLQGSNIVDAINVTATGTISASTVVANSLTVNGNSIATVALTNDYNDLTNLPNLFSGDYNDLTNKPSSLGADWGDITNKPLIPTKLSQLTNDTNFVPNSQVVINNSQVVDLATVGRTGSYTDLVDANELVTQSQIAGGTLTIDVNNTGDLKGNVLGNDSTVIVNHLTNTFTGSLTGNVTGNVSGNVTGDTTGDHIGDVYSRDGSKQVLFAGETSEEDALFRGNVSGQLFAPDDSSLLVSGDGTHYGDFKGSVFGDDSSVIVDAINRNINAVDINATNVYATTHYGNLSKSGSILSVTSNSGISLLPNGALNVPNATTVSVVAGETMLLQSADDLTIQSTAGNVIVDGYISITDLKALVATAGTYADFQTAIANL